MSGGADAIDARALALAMHEAVNGPVGGVELDCYSCARWPDANTPDYDPKPGDVCFDFAVAILAALAAPLTPGRGPR